MVGHGSSYGLFDGPPDVERQQQLHKLEMLKSSSMALALAVGQANSLQYQIMFKICGRLFSRFLDKDAC